MGNYNLKMNVARFSMENMDTWKSDKVASHSDNVAGSFNGGNWLHSDRPFVPNHMGTAYRDTLLGRSTKDKMEGKVVGVFEFVKLFEEWVGRSMIVRTICHTLKLPPRECPC
ncbi:hypothetical protein Hanom_Chr15g01390911 [Helianthus anomalus]